MPAIQRNQKRIRIERERPQHEDAFAQAGSGIPTAEYGADTCDELARIERLGEIVVRSEFEPGDAVVVIAARGQHQHGNVGAAAQARKNFKTVQPWHHHVEDDEIERFCFDARERLAAVLCVMEGETLGVEILAEHLHERAVVVDDQNLRHGFTDRMPPSPPSVATDAVFRSKTLLVSILVFRHTSAAVASQFRVYGTCGVQSRALRLGGMSGHRLYIQYRISS